MKRNKRAHGSNVDVVIGLVGDLLEGGRHSRRTAAKATGRSLPTIDRWLKAIATLKGMASKKVGRTTWIEYRSAREHDEDVKKLSRRIQGGR